jgi:hypothetical protein
MACAAVPDAPDAVVARVLADEPQWKAAYERARPAAASMAAWRDLADEVELIIVFGTWCPDSLREVPLAWKALAGSQVRVRNVPVDRSKTSPDFDARGADIRYVPTFIVRRQGLEVGRLVESPESGLLSDLLALARGTRRGVVSGRPELGRPARVDEPATRPAGPD